MTGVIVAFFVGVGAGASVMAWHYHEVAKAVDKVTAKLERVTREMHDLQRCADSADGYKRGREAGMQTKAVERFGQTFEGRKVARMRITNPQQEAAQ